MHVGLAALTLFPGRVGGAEGYVRSLLDQYVAGNGPERVSLLANRHVVGPYARSVGGAVGLVHMRSYRPGDRDATRLAAMLVARALPRLAARGLPLGLDVLHYPVTVPIPRFAGPTVVTMHDVQHHDLPMFFSRAERAFRRWAWDGAALGATRVIVLSRFGKERLVEHLDIREDRIDVVPSGIDHARFRPDGADDERLLAALGLPERFLIYPANLWPHKNHARLVEAFAQAGLEGVDLILTGQTYGRETQLHGVASRMGVSGRVHHLGFVEREVVPALYRRALAMVFPSLYEGFGMPPLEAMACGCVVTCSTAGSLAEIGGDAVLPFDGRDTESIAEALTRAGGDASLRQRLRVAGLQRAAEFTWERSARGHVDSYRRALGA